jgi:GTP1/Obg family GTP-binding protein
MPGLPLIVPRIEVFHITILHLLKYMILFLLILSRHAVLGFEAQYSRATFIEPT